MKKIIIGLIAIIILVIALIFGACSEKHEKSVSCEALPHDEIEIEFDLLGKSFISEITVLKYDINENATGIESAHCKPNEDLYLFVQYYCNVNNIEIDNKLMGIVLYYDLPISNSLKIEDVNIMGISLYLVNRNKITHRLYTKNEKSEFCEEENVKIAVSGMYYDHVNFYLEKYVFQYPNNKSHILLEGELFEDFYINRNKYRAPYKFEKKSQTRDNPELDNCPRPCTGSFASSCDLGTGKCYNELKPSTGCSCEEAEVSSRGTEYQKFINKDLMHNFKNVFLYSSSKGFEYVENYYFLSSEYSGKISVDLAIKTALVLKDFNPVMEAFMDPGNHISDVIFNDELINSILNLISEYEKITESGYGQEILDLIRKELKKMKNLKLKEILAFINLNM